jgi:hypothetical protein
MATWQTHEWPSGRCADAEPRHTLAWRRALLFPYYPQYRARPLSLAAPTHHSTSGAAFVRSLVCLWDLPIGV